MKLIYISAAMSLDGHIDDASSQRLILSSAEDLLDMKAARAECDAILVGANTIRKDNPSLLLGSADLSERRTKQGQSKEPIKVTITTTGNLNPQSNFFSQGNADKLVLCSETTHNIVSQKLSSVSKIIPLAVAEKQTMLDALSIISALDKLGIQSLFIEGGSSILTMFLSQGIFHHLRLAIAPFFVGNNNAPYLVSTALFKNNADNRLQITGVRNLGNMAVLDIVNTEY